MFLKKEKPCDGNNNIYLKLDWDCLWNIIIFVTAMRLHVYPSPPFCGPGKYDPFMVAVLTLLEDSFDV